jgi:sugar lactone lactonase YvrE
MGAPHCGQVRLTRLSNSQSGPAAMRRRRAAPAGAGWLEAAREDMVASMRRLLPSLIAIALLAPASASAVTYPDVIPLPNGWGPEGIAIRAGTPDVYVGSIPTGAVWLGDLRGGAGTVLVPPHAGRVAIGLKVDRRHRLFVAGGPTGKAFVYDARTGGDLAEYTLAEAGASFINDVVVTRGAAYFTDSRSASLGVLRLGEDGELPAQAESLPLTGDFELVTGPNAFNLNGIAATRNGRHLVAVQTETGKLFAIDARTGESDEIEFPRGLSFPNGDGLLLRGRRLYVVQNMLHQVSVVQLSEDLESGRLLRVLTHSALDVPTTIARSGSRLYVVNARFGTPVTPDTTYAIVKLPGN